MTTLYTIPGVRWGAYCKATLRSAPPAPGGSGAFAAFAWPVQRYVWSARHLVSVRRTALHNHRLRSGGSAQIARVALRGLTAALSEATVAGAVILATR